jgi:hypothetical protein
MRHLKHAATLAAFLILCASPTLAQCTLDRAPVVRGLSLGMPLADYLKLFPQTARRGLASFDPQIGEEFILVDAREREDFKGVTINTASFVDGRLAFLSFAYPDFTPASVADFTRQAAATLGLPARGWRSQGRAMRGLACKGFAVSLSTGDYGQRQEFPFLVLEDLEAKARVAERRRRTKETTKPRRVFVP